MTVAVEIGSYFHNMEFEEYDELLGAAIRALELRIRQGRRVEPIEVYRARVTSTLHFIAGKGGELFVLGVEPTASNVEQRP